MCNQCRRKELERICNHVRGFDWIQYEGGGLFTQKPLKSADSVEWFNYCPRCGEKLTPSPSEDSTS